MLGRINGGNGGRVRVHENRRVSDQTDETHMRTDDPLSK